MLNPYRPMSSAARSPRPGRLGVLDGVGVEPMLGVPARRGEVQVRHDCGGGAPELEAQQVGEQLVVAEPGAVRIERDDEGAGILELEQDRLRAGDSQQPVGERAAHPIQDRHAQQELPDGFRLALEDLGEQVVRDPAFAARERREEPLPVGHGGHRERGEAESRRPALGPCDQRVRRRRPTG